MEQTMKKHFQRDSFLIGKHGGTLEIHGPNFYMVMQWLGTSTIHLVGQRLGWFQYVPGTQMTLVLGGVDLQK